MAYDLLDAEGNEVLDDLGQPIHQRYLLSLQDMDRSAYLQELIDAGVTTFKIEGRLKDADYVTNVVAYYREKLDSLTHSFTHSLIRSFSPDPEKTFHRGGIDYFLHGRTPHMANFLTPKSTGEAIGEVLEVRGNMLRVRLRPGVTLHNGDGLSLGNEGFSVNGIDGNLIRINKSLTSHSEAVSHPTSPLYRNLDVEFTKSLRSERRIPVDILFRETEDGFELIFSIVNQSSNRQSFNRQFQYPHEPAKNAERAMETIRTQLAKLGDTPYVARDVRIETSPYFIPISTLNQWRREVLSQATAPSAVLQADRRSYSGSGPAAPQVRSNSEPGERSLMTCRYCLLFELGHCRKTNPYPRDKEPRFLRLRTGQQVRLTFDCARCEMRIYQC
jgi:putative protease